MKPGEGNVRNPLFDIGLAVILGVLTGFAPASADFTEFLEFGETHTIPVAWGDFDGDGDYDLAVGDYGGAGNELWVNEGDGTFTRREEFGAWATFAMAWADYDNDGDQDLAIGNGSGAQNKLYVNQGDGSFIGEDQFGTGLNTAGLAWGDADGDGDLDMVVANGIVAGLGQRNHYYVNNGDGTFTEDAFFFGRGLTDAVVWGDYDGDGDLDLAVGNGGFQGAAQNWLYRNDDGIFARLLRFGEGDTSCLVWGDADGDGDLDMAVANWDGGQSYLYVNEGADSFLALPRFGTRDPNTFAWGDFDNDGDFDIAAGNGDFTAADSNFIHVNDGAGVFTAVHQFGLGSTDAVAWADIDGDGDLDLAAGNEHSTPQNYLYRNEENDGASVVLHLIGRFHDLGLGYSNRDGVGAKVTIYEAGHAGDPAFRLGFREVAAHGGFTAQNAIDSHFGVPAGTEVDVRVIWPGSAGSNRVQDVTGVPVGARTTIDEGGDATSVDDASAGAPRLFFGVSPNPVRDRAFFRIRLPGPAPAGLEIFDIRGRLVRNIRLPRAGSGELYGAEWDRRDDGGRVVDSGVYFARVTGEREGPALRVVVLRDAP